MKWFVERFKIYNNKFTLDLCMDFKFSPYFSYFLSIVVYFKFSYLKSFERAIGLSILTMSEPGKFFCVELN